jgi:hypothetical protein
MTRRPFRPRIWELALVLFVVGVVAAVWWQTRPLATLTLPDGTKIYLRRVTYGTEHKYPAPIAYGATAWERISHAFRMPKDEVSGIDSPCYVFHFTQRPPSGAFETETSIQQLEVVWEDGRSASGHVSSKETCTLWLADPFPRRGRTFKTRVRIKDVWHDWELPNPAIDQTYPVWKPGEFPQVRQVGDFTVTATGWHRETGGWYLDHTVAFRGRPIARPVEFTFLQLEDATGNTGLVGAPASPNSPIWTNWLSSKESAWKVKLTAWAGIDEPLSPEHIVRFEKARIPAPGEHTILKSPALDAKGSYFAVLSGVGHFGFRNGEFFRPKRWGSQATRNSGILDEYPVSWKVLIERRTPGLILAHLGDAKNQTWLGKRNILRCKDGSGIRNMEASESYDSSTKCRSYSFGKPVPEGEIEIEALCPERIEVDFLVPPPKFQK